MAVETAGRLCCSGSLDVRMLCPHALVLDVRMLLLLFVLVPTLDVPARDVCLVQQSRIRNCVWASPFSRKKIASGRRKL